MKTFRHFASAWALGKNCLMEEVPAWFPPVARSFRGNAQLPCFIALLLSRAFLVCSANLWMELTGNCYPLRTMLGFKPPTQSMWRIQRAISFKISTFNFSVWATIYLGPWEIVTVWWTWIKLYLFCCLGRTSCFSSCGMVWEGGMGRGRKHQ